MHVDQNLLDAVLDDWTCAAVSERMRAALGLLEAMTRRPLEIDRQLLATSRAAGLDDDALRATAAVAFSFNLMNRLADALDFEVPNARQRVLIARVLNFAGRFAPPSPAGKPWRRGQDGRLRPAEVEDARSVLLSTPGLTRPALRQAVDAFVRKQWGLPAGDAELPGCLETYCTKLALHAYRIVDDDVEALRKEGYVDEAIFELTAVGAVAAATLGAEQLFQAMYVVDKS